MPVTDKLKLSTSQNLTLDRLVILNPKRNPRSLKGRAAWYPYYAGFSLDFAKQLIGSARLRSGALVLDPWNGSGTTTDAANGLGYEAYGVDLNPVMVIAAKGRMLSNGDVPSILPLMLDIISKAKSYNRSMRLEEDPLSAWFTPRGVLGIRNIEKGIRKLLIDEAPALNLPDLSRISAMSDIAAFFYVAMFRTLRVLLQRFYSSNPTWVKLPKEYRQKLRPSFESVINAFRQEVCEMLDSINGEEVAELSSKRKLNICLGSSDSLPVIKGSVDFILSSPPYCTRIDYAVATMPELALLGFGSKGNLRQLREKLIGSTTVPPVIPQQNKRWGTTCITFLEALRHHESKASESYYYKNHLQYFESIFQSLVEIKSKLTDDGRCILVVQDSFYKNLHNQLPRMFGEMGGAVGLTLMRQENFNSKRTLAGINPGTRRYRRNFHATESVLCFANS